MAFFMKLKNPNPKLYVGTIIHRTVVTTMSEIKSFVSAETFNKRASIDAANLPSPKRIADTHGTYQGFLDLNSLGRFLSDKSINHLCQKMAQSNTLVQMGQKLLEYLGGDALADHGTSKLDERKHFKAVKKVWQNEHFNGLLYKALHIQDSFLPDTIAYISRKFMHERFDERIAHIKKDYYFKSSMKVREPYEGTSVMRRLLLVLIVYWSCEDELLKLDKVECTVPVKAPANEFALGFVNVVQQLLQSMKLKGAPHGTIDALRSEVESSCATEPDPFLDDVFSAMRKAKVWLYEEGSPVPDLLGECFIMELAVEIENKNSHALVAMAKTFLENLDSFDLAASCSSLVQRHSDLLRKFLVDADFKDAFLEIRRRDWNFREKIPPYNYAYHMRRSKQIFSDDAVEDAMHRIKRDAFCTRFLKERETAAMLRGFLVILFAYHAPEILKFVDGFPPNYPREAKHIFYQSNFAGDVAELKAAVDKECNADPDSRSHFVFRKLMCIQFQHEVCRRMIWYDIHGFYRALWTEDDRYSVEFES
ncbi:unnamed protein product [Cuscuta epithymum]|uniref:Uncharacterized protein n=1 Tax=Cuscuta epithymum TaxID=186058 RepID=A0AAV0F1A7_9ASTE|nr:unnamed protein product [Cuscuta epithymum]